MDTKGTQGQIETLIKANMPLVAILSQEETRVLQALKEIAISQKSENGKPKLIIEWSIAAGLTLVNGSDAELPASFCANSNTPDAALKRLSTYPKEGRCLIVFKDLHPFFNNPIVVRSLKEAALDFLQRKGQSIILLSSQINVPPDLDTLVSVINFPLPTKDEMSKDMSLLVENLKGDHKIQVNLSDQECDQIAYGLTGLTKDQGMGVLRQAIIREKGVLKKSALNGILEEKRNIINKSGRLTYYNPDVSYESVGGLSHLKQWLKEAELSTTEAAQDFGLEPVRGVIIGGIPGTGKSLAAKAAAGGRRPLLRMSVSEILAGGGGLVGQGQAQLHKVFKTVESIGDCVLWVDEIEKGFGAAKGEMDGGTRRDILGDFLTWMQETKSPAFIVATANDMLSLPPELIRRFDEKFFVDLPGPKARREIFQIHLSKRKRSPEQYDISNLVTQSCGYTGVRLSRGLRRPYLERVESGEGDLTTAHIAEALSAIKPMSQTMGDRLAAYRNWDARPADENAPEPQREDRLSGIGGLEF